MCSEPSMRRSWRQRVNLMAGISQCGDWTANSTLMRSRQNVMILSRVTVDELSPDLASGSAASYRLWLSRVRVLPLSFRLPREINDVQ